MEAKTVFSVGKCHFPAKAEGAQPDLYSSNQVRDGRAISGINDPAGRSDDGSGSSAVSDGLQVISSPPAFSSGVSLCYRTGNRTILRTDAHHPADATLQFWPRPNTKELSRCVFPPAAPPSCPAASWPASDSCAPPLRCSPASSTRRPRCATTTEQLLDSSRRS